MQHVKGANTALAIQPPRSRFLASSSHGLFVPSHLYASWIKDTHKIIKNQNPLMEKSSLEKNSLTPISSATTTTANSSLIVKKNPHTLLKKISHGSPLHRTWN
jgi:hypothetical protein